MDDSKGKGLCYLLGNGCKFVVSHVFTCFIESQSVDVNSLIADGGSFFVSIGVVGEMSTGKSTFVNAVFGDVLAEVSTDRTTTIPHRFFESPNIKDNQDTCLVNKIENVQAKIDWAKDKRQLCLNRFYTYWNNYWEKIPEFHEFPLYMVKPSDIIARKGKSTNV